MKKFLDKKLESYSLKQIFLFGILIYVVAYFILFIITNILIFTTGQYDPSEMWFLFYDFRRFYYQEGLNIITGKVPFVHYTPLYPIVAEYYLSIFTFFGQNPNIARIFQLALIIGTLLVGFDLVKIIKLENPKVHYLLLIISLPFFIFSMVLINYDILVVFLMLIAIDFCLRKKYVLTGIFLALGFHTKMFPIILVIPIIIILLKNKDWKNSILFLLACSGTILAISAPFVVLTTIVQGSGFLGILLNTINVFIAPLSFVDDKALTIPFYFFQLGGINKFILKMVQAISAFGLVAIVSIIQARKGRKLDLQLLFSAMMVFFLFQPYIMYWYFLWIIPIYHLQYKEKPEREYITHQSLFLINFVVFGLMSLIMFMRILDTYIISLLLHYELLLPNGELLPAFIMGCMVAYTQVLVLIFYTTNKWKYQKILIPLNLGLLILSLSLMPLTFFLYA